MLLTPTSGLVRQRRKELGWTEADLAKAMGSSQSRISKMEKGDQSVNKNMIRRALVVMGYSFSEVMISPEDPSNNAACPLNIKKLFAAKLLIRRQAEVIAGKISADAGDVEHILQNLIRSPEKRLYKGLAYAQFAADTPFR